MPREELTEFGLESKMVSLETLISSVLVRLDCLCSESVWKVVTCNIRKMNNPVKQDDIICWFDNVQVFTFGLKSGYLDASVVVIINSSLVRHMSKISEVPGWLLSIKLLFKNKISVSILGLYIGAFSVAVNKFFFIILSGDFNEDGSYKCVSFKKCVDLELINSLVSSLAVKESTWANFRGIMKMIDFVFVSPNLKFNFKNAGKDKWNDFKNATLVNVVMDDVDSFVFLIKCWCSLDNAKALVVQDLVDFDTTFDHVCSALFGARKSYCALKFAESLRAKKVNIKSAIDKRIESFKINKSHTIKSVLKCPFHKVVLDHLVVDDELVLEPGLVKSKINMTMKSWTQKHQTVSDVSSEWCYQAFSGVMCLIDFDEFFGVVFGLLDGKTAGLLGILNELWKHCDKSILKMLLVLLNSCLSGESVFSSWKET
ncbi:hypothetical protein G9A89_012796 [Geosiphon pyriformis]|nr:hypothetical protein G9A89_012796 [Geosiphon pyriformis]